MKIFWKIVSKELLVENSKRIAVGILIAVPKELMGEFPREFPKKLPKKLPKEFLKESPTKSQKKQSCHFNGNIQKISEKKKQLDS